MQYRRLNQLKKEYLRIPIPQGLDFIKKTGVAVASAAIFVVLLTAGVNSSPVFAAALTKVPVIGGIVRVLTFREYTVNEDRFNADIKVPSIHGLENKALENSLNEKYLAENKKLYEEFKVEMENMQKNGQGNSAVDSGYMIKTDTNKILSIGRYTVITNASGVEKLKYDTIDKENEILITLPSLFKDNSYVEIISENIKLQSCRNDSD
ncbi:DUF4179 domain-containing protein [Phosphitispora fastidiosa]|uniref:DUF4179 domain-containing protein n=1 Tax=Phosphitispora fastidiosa TaxID=2837202 RepID=UPI001E659E55|nr:DUF4179 domain-containing protein [Phosphitispora fastidiosa]MBU7005865.1 hypothetical protein [Phosphitispora fastidiosa]